MKKLGISALVLILVTFCQINAQNEVVNGVLSVNNTEANTIRVENDASGGEATIRFRSKPTNGIGIFHADISSYATGQNTGFLGFKLPHNNAFGSGFDIIMDHNGRMGIGTTSPSHPLSVGMSDTNFPTHWPTAVFKGGIIIGSDGNSSATYISNQSENGIHGLNAYNYGTGRYLPVHIGWGNNDIYLSEDGGKVGIGNTSPSHTLSVGMTNPAVGAWASALFDAGIMIGSSGNSTATYLYNQSETGVHGINAYNYETGQFIPVHVGWNGNDVYIAKDGGSVGIGTTDTDGHQLAVNGSIKSKKVMVDPDSWSDFVFEANYELPTLEEVEKHIDEKGHLPSIPSEAEVLQNGIDIGEMDASLLQKIEELTLYIIDMNKQLKAQNAKIEQLQKENAQLR